MTWVRLDDTMPEHPKVAGLSNAAFRLHVEGLCYCARNLSDGAIPRPIARRMAPGRVASELVDAAVWDEGEGAYQIHDYLEYQLSRDDVIDRREKRADAGRRGAEARWRGDGKSDGKSHGKRHGKSDGKTMPRVPAPSPTPEEPTPFGDVANAPSPVDPAARPLRDHVEQVWAEYRQRHPTAVFTTARRQLIQRRLADYPWTTLVTAIRGNHLDPHCNGENDRGRQYHSIELILRDAAHIEQYAAIASPNGDGPAGESRLARAKRVAAEREGAAR